jgi:hypothetical protein
MTPELNNSKNDKIGTTDGEAVLVAESVTETAQNEPKTAESPTGESGQLGVIDPIVSVETSTGEAKPAETISAQAEAVASAQAPTSQAVTPEPRSGENTASASWRSDRSARGSCRFSAGEQEKLCSFSPRASEGEIAISDPPAGGERNLI